MPSSSKALIWASKICGSLVHWQLENKYFLVHFHILAKSNLKFYGYMGKHRANFSDKPYNNNNKTVSWTCGATKQSHCMLISLQQGE